MQTQLEISQTGLQGQGVAYDSNGNVYFVERALPGDRILADYEEGAKRYRDATLVEILRASSERKASPCPYFQKCGGCDWLDWNYSAQLRAKENTVRHTLERLGLKPKLFLPILPAEEVESYRHRIQLRQQGSRLGFYKRKSHEVVDIESCLVAHPKINEKLKQLRENLLPSEDTQKVELLVNASGEVEEIWNAPHGAMGFVQNHGPQNEKLRKTVTDFIQRAEAQAVFELYCGNGNFSFAYAPQVERLVGIDENPHSIAAANKQRDLNGLTHAEFYADRVSRALALRAVEKFELPYDTLLVNPPRKGMGGMLDTFLRRDLRSILYVSCSPPAFSRDVGGLSRGGFHLECVQPIDMFPQTHHVEFVSLFLRSC